MFVLLLFYLLLLLMMFFLIACYLDCLFFFVVLVEIERYFGLTKISLRNCEKCDECIGV